MSKYSINEIADLLDHLDLDWNVLDQDSVDNVKVNAKVNPKSVKRTKSLNFREKTPFLSDLRFRFQ